MEQTSWAKAVPLPGDQSIRGRLWKCMYENEYPGARIDHVMNVGPALDAMVEVVRQVVEGEDYVPSDVCTRAADGVHRGVMPGPNSAWICGVCGCRVGVEVSDAAATSA